MLLYRLSCCCIACHAAVSPVMLLYRLSCCCIACHAAASPFMLLLNALVDQPLFCNLLAECLQPADHSNY
jgi:hypothetical protein